MPPKAKKRPTSKTYSGRVAIRLRELRESRGWSVAKLGEHLTLAGHTVPPSSIYAYEFGKDANGVDLPLELIPFYSKAFGFKSAIGVLPAE